MSTPPYLRCFERDALVACGLLAVGGLALSGWRVALSVAGGGALAWVSYRALKGAMDAVGSGAPAGPWTLVKFFTRHAILAFAAYVMLSRLRASPLGLIAGVSAPVLALGAAAVRTIIPARRPGTPR
jgi:ATP synthase I chain